MGRITSAPSMLKREHKGFPRSRGNARQGKGGRHPVGATLVAALPLRSAQGGRGERRGMPRHPINAETPNNYYPSFASFKNQSHHGSQCGDSSLVSPCFDDSNPRAKRPV